MLCGLLKSKPYDVALLGGESIGDGGEEHTALEATAVSISACSASTTNIANTQLARGYTDGQATDMPTTFSPSDTPLHYVVTLANAPDDTTVKTVWTIVDAGDGQFKEQKLDETVLPSGSGVLNFTLAGTQECPVGKYRVDLYLNDKLDRSTEFSGAA